MFWLALFSFVGASMRAISVMRLCLAPQIMTHLFLLTEDLAVSILLVIFFDRTVFWQRAELSPIH